MIKANELRIGNWVECLKEYRIAKERYKESPPIYCKIESLHDIGINVQVIRKTLEPYWKYTELTGIPLTPDILEKAGFVESVYRNRTQRCFSNMDEYKRFDVKFKIANPNEIFISSTYHRNVTHIKYLHQLQNLFFALCGKELNIEL